MLDAYGPLQARQLIFAALDDNPHDVQGIGHSTKRLEGNLGVLAGALLKVNASWIVQRAAAYFGRRCRQRWLQRAEPGSSVGLPAIGHIDAHWRERRH